MPRSSAINSVRRQSRLGVFSKRPRNSKGLLRRSKTVDSLESSSGMTLGARVGDSSLLGLAMAVGIGVVATAKAKQFDPNLYLGHLPGQNSGAIKTRGDNASKDKASQTKGVDAKSLSGKGKGQSLLSSTTEYWEPLGQYRSSANLDDISREIEDISHQGVRELAREEQTLAAPILGTNKFVDDGHLTPIDYLDAAAGQADTLVQLAQVTTSTASDAGSATSSTGSGQSGAGAQSVGAQIASAISGTPALVALGALAVVAAASSGSSKTETKSDGDTTAPKLLSVTRQDNSILLKYDEKLDNNNLPPLDAFTIEVNNAPRTVSSLKLDSKGDGLILELQGDVVDLDDRVTVKYIAGAGNQAKAIQDASGNDASSFTQITVADGYIQGAKVYVDKDSDGVADLNELIDGLITDEFGNFALPQSANPNNLALIVEGGFNKDTGIKNTVSLKTPAGSTVVNPLTTLVQTVIQNSSGSSTKLSAEEAASKVAASLGLGDFNLLKVDPIAILNNQGADAERALTAQSAAVTIVAAASLAGDEAKAASVLSSMAKTASDGKTNPTSKTSLETALKAAQVREDLITKIEVAREEISKATSLSSISTAQSKALDRTPPDPPKDVTVPALGNDTTPTLRVSFNSSDAKGNPVVKGDTIELTLNNDPNLVFRETLSTEDIRNEFVDINIHKPLSEGEFKSSVKLIDQADNPSQPSDIKTFRIDTTSPTIEIKSNKAALKAGETATITFTFSEDPGTSFTWDGSVGDVTVTNGTLGALSGSGLTRTATFTPEPNLASGKASITVADNSYTDAAENNGVAGTTPSISLDTLTPTVAITSSKSALKAGESATITFSFSEDPVDSFTWDGSSGDVSVTNGTLGALSGSGLTRTATFTPSTNLASGSASITVAANSYTDAAGNNGAAGTVSSINLDTLTPTFTSPSSGTVPEDRVANLEVYKALATDSSVPLIYGLKSGADSATFNIDKSTGSVTVAQGTSFDFELGKKSFEITITATDTFGNAAELPLSLNLTDVNEAPYRTKASYEKLVLATGVTVSANVDYSQYFSDFDAGDVLTFKASGLPAGLTLTPGGMLSGTPSASAEVDITITATDKAGLSQGEEFALSVVNAPTVLNASANLTTAKSGTPVTITLSLSEKVSIQTPNELTLSLLVGELPLTATYGGQVPAEGTDKLVFNTTVGSGNSQSVSLGSFSGSQITGTVTKQSIVSPASQLIPDFKIDNTAPELEIRSDKTALKTGETATITFSFNEDPGTSFTWDGSVGDVTVTNGTLGALSGSGLTRTAKFTPEPNLASGKASITVAANSYTDAAGNNGAAGTAPSISLDTLTPTVAITSSKSALKAGESATITFSFSEDPGASFTWDGSSGDVSVTNGTLGALSGSGLTRTATFTPTPNTQSGSASIEVISDSYTDAAGNTGLQATSAPITFDTKTPNVDISSNPPSLKNVGETAVLTFTLTEASTEFTQADIDVVGGSISNFSGSGSSYTATFLSSSATDMSVSVGAQTFSDAVGNTNNTKVSLSLNQLALLSSSLDNVQNLSPISNIVLSFSAPVTAGDGKIRIVNDVNTEAKPGFRRETTDNTIVIDPKDNSQVTISGSKVIINPSADLDLSNNYHLDLDAGAFTANAASLSAYSGASTLNFSTVTPGSSLASAAVSQKMTDDGSLVDAHKWFDIEGLGSQPSTVVTVSLNTGSYALIAKDYDQKGGNNDFDGLGVGNFYIRADQFGIDDLVYFDNQSNAKNNLEVASIVDYGTPPTLLQFAADPNSQEGLGGLIEMTLQGSNATFDSIKGLQDLFKTSSAPVISA